MQQFKTWRRASFRQQQQQPQQPQPHDPVLTAEDENFLREIMEDSAGDQSTSRSVGSDPQLSPVSPLETGVQPPPSQSPVSPVEEYGRELGEEERKARESTTDRKKSTASAAAPETPKPEVSTSPPPAKKGPWNWLRRRSTVLKKENGTVKASPQDDNNKLSEAQQPPTETDKDEAEQEKEDMTEILERLNLAAENNRVFSMSNETRELLRKFTLIFKDLVNGVPTAYHDLEMLLTNGNKQLQSTYSQLPGFVQKLIQKLPEKWTETLAPEVLAAATAKASQSGLSVENVGKAAAAANKMGIKVPSLKELVGKPAALVGMLRSIVAFLRARFPAVLGLNVLWSLALTILLFVLWYCHKRGREVRLENERLVTEEEIGKLNDENSAEHEQIRTTETLTTTAPQGASVAELRQGIEEAQHARLTAAAASPPVSDDGPQKNQENETPDESAKPKRAKSRLSIWTRSEQKPTTPKIEPYPGT
ncbi:uncharacterized protein BP01DRAFT_134587 [Aspergillus saccharolyticus JOP 1030-1]|uniref:Uncharacterized protein n=1 Tax=Aspergillus saccharolyticus JOP 1030-1 TaxID=1450539 RepID=A0A318Z5J3_9EURO|nr:hypothetical protein BP01DRAFT_134587 [Aspergillus saccharolyticus JOP 1030-1]PYH42359.1 hypothetical protein BP01DRAFT_134587 [Aspergillus saccharolyticus JOP 1030-1]